MLAMSSFSCKPNFFHPECLVGISVPSKQELLSMIQLPEGRTSSAVICLNTSGLNFSFGPLHCPKGPVTPAQALHVAWNVT